MGQWEWEQRCDPRHGRRHTTTNNNDKPFSVTSGREERLTVRLFVRMLFAGLPSGSNCCRGTIDSSQIVV